MKIREAKKVMDILAAYDLFQLENNIKPDFCNISEFNSGMNSKMSGMTGI